MLMAFPGPEAGSGARRTAQVTKVQTGEERGWGNYNYCMTRPFSVLTAAGRIPHSHIWVSTLHLVPKMEVSDSHESRTKPQNDTDDL